MMSTTGEKTDKADTTYLISIVIIVKNEENRIGKCIDSLLCQKGIENCEVMFVDGNSSDNTISVISRYMKEHDNFRIICCDRSGYAYQRNVGITHAKGEYILFISGDTVCDPKLLLKYINGINQGYEVIQGTVIQDGNDKMARVLYKLYRKTMDNDLEDISTVNILVKRALFKSNMFDVSNVASEDKLWYLFLRDKSNYYRMKGAIVCHAIHENVKQYSKKIQKEAEGIGTSLALHSNLWKNHDYFGWLKVTVYQCITLLVLLILLLIYLFMVRNHLILGVGIVVCMAFELYKLLLYRMYENNLKSIMILELFIFSAQKGMIKGILKGLLKKRKYE